jgi:hypothetical protein
MKLENYARLSRALSGLCPAHQFVLITTIALCATSCSSTRKLTTTEEDRGSVYARESVEVFYQTVPRSQVSLQLPVGDILHLPAGAVYAAQDGQAQVTVRVRNDTIIIYAVCDSLRREVERYETTLREAHSNIARLEVERETGLMLLKKGLIAGLVLVLLITILGFGFKFLKK